MILTVFCLIHGPEVGKADWLNAKLSSEAIEAETLPARCYRAFTKHLRFLMMSQAAY